MLHGASGSQEQSQAPPLLSWQCGSLLLQGHSYNCPAMAVEPGIPVLLRVRSRKSPTLPGVAAAAQAMAADLGISALSGTQEVPLPLQAQRCLVPLPSLSPILVPAIILVHS